MNYGELAQRLQDFRDTLIEHRELWAKSLDDIIPDEPVRNGAALERQQRVLARQIAILDPYLALLSPGRMMEHRLSGNRWDIFRAATGTATAIIKGDSLSNSILQLEGMIAIAQTHAVNDAVQIPDREERGKPKPSHSIHVSGGNVNIGDLGTINVNVSVADFLKTAIAEIEGTSKNSEQVQTLREKLKALLDHPLGRLLAKIGVGEVLKHL
jgi:hypothetical protein